MSNLNLKINRNLVFSSIRRSFAFGKIKKVDPFAIVKNPKFNDKVFDAVVIGGGSGGIAFATEAKSKGFDVAVLDYVTPTQHNNQWGIGGTCVNVGCIPKKLFHNAALLHNHTNMAKPYGYKFDSAPKFEWKTLRDNVQTYIKKLNYDYNKSFKDNDIDNINAFASILDNNTVLFSPEPQNIWNFVNNGGKWSKEMEGKVGRLNTKNIIISVGGRPFIPSEEQIPGAKYAITSDDIFFLESLPENTLVVGGGYIACESAGFLAELGSKVDLCARSMLLREFDRDCASFVMNSMTSLNHNLNTTENCLPEKIEKLDNGKLRVTMVNTKTQEHLWTKDYDCVMMAVTRKIQGDALNLDNIGVERNQKNGKIKGIEYPGLNRTPLQELSTLKNVWAIGDCLDGIPE